MKKLMTVFLAAAIVFAVAGQASATALETSGEFRARFWYLENYLANENNAEFWDQRLRLQLVWPVAEGVKITARADMMEGLWGDNVLVSNTTAAGTPAAVTTFAANPNTRPPVAWDWINLQFAWPGTPLTFTVGRQDASWGPGMFVKSDNRDRFKVTAKLGAATLLYTYDKYTEIFGQFDPKSSLDDRRQHSIGAIGALAGWNVGLIYGMVLDNTNPNVDFTLNAIDGYAMGKVGPADIKAEITYAIGENDLVVGTDQDLEGLMAYLGVALPVGPMTLGLEGAWARGDDPTTPDGEGLLRADYQAPFWSVILFNNMDYQGYDTQNAFASDFGLTNAMAAKASVTLSPMKGLSVYGAAVYAVRDEVKAGVDDAMGTEFDLVATYAITPNVSWTVGGGYLMAGDFYGNVDDPWGAMSAFTVKF